MGAKAVGGGTVTVTKAKAENEIATVAKTKAEEEAAAAKFSRAMEQNSLIDSS